MHQVVDYPGNPPQRGPQQGRTGGPDAARRHHQPADLAELAAARSRRRSGWTGAPASATTSPCRPRSTAWIRSDALLRTPIGAPCSSVNTNTATSLAGSANAGNADVGAGPNQASAAYGNPGRGVRRPAAAVESGRPSAAASRPAIVNHYNVQPVFDVYANVDRRDLGSVGAEVEKIVGRDDAPSCRAAPRSRCAARSPPCRPRSTGWAWA